MTIDFPSDVKPTTRETRTQSQLVRTKHGTIRVQTTTKVQPKSK